MLFMIQTSHQAVDTLNGVRIAQIGNVQVDHGGLQRCMTEILLNNADVHPGFEQMRGVGVAQRMKRRVFFIFGSCARMRRSSP